MLTEIPLSQQIGKTLSKICNAEYSGPMVLVFSDGTFSTIRPTRECEDAPSSIEESRLNFLDYDLSDKQIIDAGLCTQNELFEMRESRKRINEENIKKYKKQQYEALKREFGE